MIVKEGLKEHAEISFKLNSYDDIFSTFDSREYDKKAFSEDFLTELKRAAQDKSSITKLNLSILAKKRNEHEREIKRRNSIYLCRNGFDVCSNFYFVLLLRKKPFFDIHCYNSGARRMVLVLGGSWPYNF